MTYSQIFTEKPEYLLAITDGEVADVDAFILWAASVVSKAKIVGKKQILFDNRTFALRFPPPDVLTLGKQMEDVGIVDWGLRMAVISCPENKETSLLVERIFMDRGVGYMRFESQHEAKQWFMI